MDLQVRVVIFYYAVAIVPYTLYARSLTTPDPVRTYYSRRHYIRRLSGRAHGRTRDNNARVIIVCVLLARARVNNVLNNVTRRHNTRDRTITFSPHTQTC